jgi:hypothetical protein
MNDLPELEPGDALLYRPNSVAGWIIAVKTWSPVCHVEIYTGGEMSVASRDGRGVNRYPLRWKQLAAVLRPAERFLLPAAEVWFEKRARGQKYDWLGLLCFTLAVKRGSPDRMFCSEFATRFYRQGGFQVVHRRWDADKVAPGSLLMSPAFEWVWIRAGLAISSE